MSTRRFVLGTVLGAAMGALLGLIVAPRSGKETRQWLRQTFGDVLDEYLTDEVVGDVVNTAKSKVKEKAGTMAADLKEQAALLSQELEAAGRKAVDAVSEQLGKLEGKNLSQEVANKLRATLADEIARRAEALINRVSPSPVRPPSGVVVDTAINEDDIEGV